jgi:hypothetical protein
MSGPCRKHSRVSGGVPEARSRGAVCLYVHMRLHPAHHPHTLPDADAPEQLCCRLTAGQQAGSRGAGGGEAIRCKAGLHAERVAAPAQPRGSISGWDSTQLRQQCQPPTYLPSLRSRVLPMIS